MSASRYLASVGWIMVGRKRPEQHNADLRNFYTVNFNRALRFPFPLSLTLP